MGGDEDCHGDGILKEVFVLIKGEAGCLMRGFAKLENIGSTVIKYSWLVCMGDLNNYFIIWHGLFSVCTNYYHTFFSRILKSDSVI